ncbi:MAG: LEA type 2 family protein [Blastocatellia bacterium]|nr:LEA type 2 family protein [Blastocatellia bacterium]
MKNNSIIGRSVSALALCLLVSVSNASGQIDGLPDKYSDKLVEIKLNEVILEEIDFRDQKAHLSVGLEIKNPFIPLTLKDFEYRLRLFGLETLEGSHDGEMKLGGKDVSRIRLPLTVNLRSIPEVVWSAFSNRGRLKFDLDTGFTIPLYVFEKRFEKSLSGEVPLKTLVDAASILRARGF